MICPTCRARMCQDVEEEWDDRTRRWLTIPAGWSCEGCAQDAALDRERERTPWRFRQDGAVDEHDVMAQMIAAGHDGWPVRR